MKYIYTGFIFFLSLGLWMLKRAYENNLVTHKVHINNDSIHRPLTILFISDIHRRKIPEQWFRSLPDADLVLIGGDMTEKGVSYDRVKANAALLAEAGNAYFVFGNNDEEVDKNRLSGILKGAGITVLENESVVLDDHYALSGIGDINYRKDDLNAAFKEVGNRNVILLSHDPRVARKLAGAERSDQIRLILSGHTHGGQIRIFGFGPYEKGQLIKKDHYTQLISNGYGTTVIPMRLGAKSEVHLLKIY
ncbi:hypothetical protein JMA_20110 [Jeotgalibacillus malaysiensis]|uniref:Calcineurin-like phosphoesterase domain-containing protein n=1 Tax=Jeotgalibacillus malaysiensis TaxID=1508404 RepID=A0A0B5ARZ9_9BACL|nr:metallophosphoesterase [Jeotgalibacillus malaysiensis]AJD91328.1 hypothetical protein JMA_20110 [Jeotgalibacillus malaysiensis]